MAGGGGGVDSQFGRGLDRVELWLRRRQGNGCNPAQTRRSARVSRCWVGSTQASLATGQRGRRRPATKFNAPVVLQTDRVRAKTRKPDTTLPRNRFLAGADSQLCHR